MNATDDIREMRAIAYKHYGGPEELESTRLPRPVPGRGQLLVRVHAASVNPIDWKLASGKFRLVRPTSFPHVPGFDAAGEVVATGAGVAGFATGDRVHTRLARGGATAEYTVTSPDVTARIPDGMDDTTAAGLPLAGMTALQGLRDHGRLPLTGARERVLVVGASGGVGHFAVQIARAAGATVIAVSRQANHEALTALGAHECIDYQRPNAYEKLAPCDLVLDCVGGDAPVWQGRLGAGGRYVSATPTASTFVRAMGNPFASRPVKAVLLRPNAADLRILDELFSAGQLRVLVDSRFPIERLAAAWARSISGRAVGKIIIDVSATASKI